MDIHDVTTGFPAKQRLRNERRNSILMTFHYPDLDSASDWLKQISLAALPIENTGQIWVVTHHQYGISPALVLRSHFAGKLLVVPRNVSSFLRLYCSTMLSVSQSNSFLNVIFFLCSDLRIKKTFDENPILWSLISIVARG